MAFYHLPHPWNPGYAVPEYVLGEPPGRGTFTTKMLPRRTISALPPDFLAKPVHTLSKPSHGKNGSLSKPSHGKNGSLSGSSLGNDEVFKLEPLGQGGGEKLLESYGNEISSWIVKNIKTVPPKEREAALREFLNKVDPGLASRIETTNLALKNKGMSAEAALKKALAMEFEKGFGQEIVSLGKKGPPAKPPAKGHVAMARNVAQGKRAVSGWQGLGGTVTNFVSSGLDKVGDAACKVLTNPLAPAIGGGIAATQGVPPQIGAAGVMVGASMCSTTGGGVMLPPPQPSTPEWLLPVAIGGGALLLVLALK